MGGQKWKRPFWGGRRARFGGNRAKWGHWGCPMMWVCLPQCQGADATQGAIFLPGGVEGGPQKPLLPRSNKVSAMRADR